MKYFKTYTHFINEAQSWNSVAKVMDKALKKAKVPMSYAKDYVKSLERLAKESTKKFFDEYGDFTEDDFIEDVEYNMANESVVNEGASNPMSSLLQSFEKAMTNKKAYADIVDELEGAPADMKSKIMQMADKNIPEAGTNIQGMIDSLTNGSLTADMLGMPGGEAKAISQFKKGLKVVDFAIKTIKKHVNESVNEASGAPRGDLAIKDLEKQGSEINWLDDADAATKKIWKKAGVNPEDENTVILYSYVAHSWPAVKKILKKNNVDFKELKDPNSAGESFIVFVNESIVTEGKYSSTKDADDVFFLWDDTVDNDRAGIDHGTMSGEGKKSSSFTFDSTVKELPKFIKAVKGLIKKNNWKSEWTGNDTNLSIFEAYSDEQRMELADKGFALSDGSYPIKNLQDLKNAIMAYGRAKDQARTAKFIVKRAKALGAEDLIPNTADFQKSLKESKLNEAMDIGKHPIPAKEFAKYMKEFAKEIMQAKRDTSKEDWPTAEKVAKYLKSATTPKTVDEYIKWHNEARDITGGKSFGMGSGFSDASSLISSIATEDDNITSAMVDKWDSKILPYIDKKAK